MHIQSSETRPSVYRQLGIFYRWYILIQITDGRGWSYWDVLWMSIWYQSRMGSQPYIRDEYWTSYGYQNKDLKRTINFTSQIGTDGHP
jgi:hypothetical protein